jgi:hypothetical protein
MSRGGGRVAPRVQSSTSNAVVANLFIFVKRLMAAARSFARRLAPAHGHHAGDDA